MAFFSSLPCPHSPFLEKLLGFLELSGPLGTAIP